MNIMLTEAQAIIQRLEAEIKPQADRIVQTLLRVLDSLNSKSSVADTVFAALGALATALEEDFQKYMSPFGPYLFNALNNQEEPALCAMAIGLVSDITRSLGPLAQPYCDDFMNSLLENLKVGFSFVSSIPIPKLTDFQSTQLSNQFKPAILQCFGDIAQSIGGAFEKYLAIVAQVLDQAASIRMDQANTFEIMDYVVSLREGIMDAWAGTIIAMKGDNKSIPWISSYDLNLG